MTDNIAQLSMAIALFDKYPTMDQIKVVIVLVFSSLVGLAFIVALACMVYFRIKQTDIGVWQNVFLTCLGYIVGIITGLLGVPVPSPGG